MSSSPPRTVRPTCRPNWPRDFSRIWAALSGNVSIPATASIADTLRVLKANSSRWVHEQFPERKRFGWQAGYGAFTVSGSRSDDVRNYIASQEAHHRKVSFQEEFLTLLRKHGLEYDARDVWG